MMLCSLYILEIMFPTEKKRKEDVPKRLGGEKRMCQRD